MEISDEFRRQNTARDDFGIGEVNLVAKVGEREDKIRLQRDDARRLLLRDQFTGFANCAARRRRRIFI
jgi:hypothetical protein